MAAADGRTYLCRHAGDRLRQLPPRPRNQLAAKKMTQVIFCPDDIANITLLLIIEYHFYRLGVTIWRSLATRSRIWLRARSLIDMLFLTGNVSAPSLGPHWQTLELAATAGWVAFVFKGLLAKLKATVSSGPLHPTAATMSAAESEEPTSLQAANGPLFDRWFALADEYAAQFVLMQRGDPHARGKAIRLSKQMLRMNEEMTCSA